MLESTTLETRCLEAMSEMQHRGLHSSASWLGEMLTAATSSSSNSNSNSNNHQHPLLQAHFEFPRPTLIESDTVSICLGESYLHGQEHKRCTNLLRNEPGFRASFLGLYALYLDGEKQKDVAGAQDLAATERASLSGGVSASSFAVDAGAVHGGASSVLGSQAGGNMHADIPPGLRRNHHAADLDRALSSMLSFTTHSASPQRTTGSSSSNNNNNDDASSSSQASPPLMREHCTDHAYLHWLHGVVRRERGFREEALASLQLAVALEPLLWCAWQDLASVVNNEADVQAVLDFVFHSSRPSGFNEALGWIGTCFSAVTKAEMQILPPAIAEFETLLRDFRGSAFLNAKLGAALYHRKDFPQSRDAFEAAIACDPLRLEGLDDFANVLFVAGDKRRLAALAQSSYAVDPFRAETSCIAGNFFAMLRRHAQSVQHFRRAVTIDRRNASAWTLLGHGYVEVKHTSAAVDAYNTAVEVDRRDYRAWYGLGQIFELLHLHPQALEFYRHAAAVRPHDPRMWTVVAGCLEKQGRHGEAIKCLERAEQCEVSTTESYCDLVRRMAEFFANLKPAHADSVQKASHYYGKLLQSPHSNADDRITAMLYLCASRVFESFELLEIMARQHSQIVSLQQRNMPLTAAQMAKESSSSNSNSQQSQQRQQPLGDNNINNDVSPPPPRTIPLPQAGTMHFGRAQPRLGGPELRRQRAGQLVGEVEAMLGHLQKELERGQVAGAIVHVPAQLQAYLGAYGEDVGFLKRHLE